MFTRALLPQHGTALDCGWTIQPPDMEGSCKYIEQAVADSQ
jgi:hypothetical protein